MSGNHANARPTCTWVPVTDETGRTHLEAHWGDVLGQVHHRAA